jgi:hypothetical protein
MLDFGVRKSNTSRPWITDETGKKIKFVSRAAMLNMMYKEGFEIVSVVTVVDQAMGNDFIYTFKKMGQ